MTFFLFCKLIALIQCEAINAKCSLDHILRINSSQQKQTQLAIPIYDQNILIELIVPQTT